MDMTLLTKPARDLSDSEALDVLVYLFDTKKITLPDGVKRDPKHPDIILSPTPGAQLKVGPKMGDVTFRRANDRKRLAHGPEGSDEMTELRPTPTFAVLLYRLGVFLHDRWQVTSVVCGGVGASHNGASDCHSQGRCVDFYGVERAGGQPIDVRKNWYERPVYKGPGHQTLAESHQITFKRWVAREAAKRPVHLDRGANWPGRTPPFGPFHLSTPRPVGVVSLQRPAPRGHDDDQWGHATDTYFRLGDSSEPEDATPCEFFSSVYDFVTAQCTTGSDDVSAAEFRRGGPLRKGYIFHPDYPLKGGGPSKTAGRVTHHDHMHFQIGRTR